MTSIDDLTPAQLAQMLGLTASPGAGAATATAKAAGPGSSWYTKDAAGNVTIPRTYAPVSTSGRNLKRYGMDGGEHSFFQYQGRGVIPPAPAAAQGSTGFLPQGFQRDQGGQGGGMTGGGSRIGVSADAGGTPGDGRTNADGSARDGTTGMPSDNGLGGFIDRTPAERAAWMAAGFMPGPIGTIASLANAGITANNLSYNNDVMQGLGLPGLSAAQIAGAYAPFGLGNDYGTKNFGNTPAGRLAAYGIERGWDNAQPNNSDGISAAPASGIGGISARSIGADGSYGPSVGLGASRGLGGFGGDRDGSDGSGGGSGGDGGGGGGGGGSSNGGGPSHDSPRADGGMIYASGGLVDHVSPGRADKVRDRVTPGTYIVPADVVSALGEGNTAAGAKALDAALSRLPAGADDGFARGGQVPVRLSGGEYKVPPARVAALGGGNVNRGADLLDKLVAMARADLARKASSLPPPK